MSLLRQAAFSLLRTSRCMPQQRCMSQQVSSSATRFVERPGESVEQKRSRLLYQSRKRGILENDLLLGTFASKYLAKMSADELNDYDHIINEGANNEWDLYYWMTGNAETPEKYQTKMMARLQEHAKNADKESRLRQPEI
ncbi:succinate dehydrogenase assembly factor 2-A, mitochondrial-like [Sycon ciliatum]|uniref:succinate dehydrogenase assembly factor 2-A, mitochondrial-like n=1 Tax=Sycon ciliatum TaxID=27933 RepID=UPI0031F6A82D|eukprot:scpid21995/ scgid30798/ Succinate dehydrogenase assembly factor 2-A, mitochondrial; Succinate dehydrogenase subunit 5-A, mitochondrial